MPDYAGEDPGDWVLRVVFRAFGFALAQTTRHNPDIDGSVIALRLGHESVEMTQMYLRAELRLKEEALSKVTRTDVPLGRFRPDGELLPLPEGL